MTSNDTNATPEQRKPQDVSPRDDFENRSDRQSMASPAVQPADEPDESERPVVDPVTGGTI